jgi:hypothetical protein
MLIDDLSLFSGFSMLEPVNGYRMDKEEKFIQSNKKEYFLLFKNNPFNLKQSVIERRSD